MKFNCIQRHMKTTDQYFPCGAVNCAVQDLQGGSKFESVDEILKCDYSNESC